MLNGNSQSDGSINGNDDWQLIQTIKQCRKLSRLSNSKVCGSFCVMSCQLCAVLK
jgi:hypothetical protein